MRLSICFFTHLELDPRYPLYHLVIEAARFADAHRFEAIWLPERHFHEAGGSYPSPAVLAAAIAMRTERLRLRAGSVVLPLHHDVLRVVEDWSVVDNLSGGRVDLSFATGWNPRDFALVPDAYERRKEVTFAQLESFRALWNGGAARRLDGNGKVVSIRAYPTPVQRAPATWLTCSGSRERFVDAGRLGCHVLTSLLGQTRDDLAANIAAYRAARASGDNPGLVTVMLPTYVGEDPPSVAAKLRATVERNLRGVVELYRPLITQQLGTIESLSDADLAQLMERSLERYAGSSLIGTVDSCRGVVEALRAIGVDEIACLLDFGIDTDSVLGALPRLDAVRRAVT